MNTNQVFIQLGYTTAETNSASIPNHVPRVTTQETINISQGRYIENIGKIHSSVPIARLNKLLHDTSCAVSAPCWWLLRAKRLTCGLDGTDAIFMGITSATSSFDPTSG